MASGKGVRNFYITGYEMKRSRVIGFLVREQDMDTIEMKHAIFENAPEMIRCEKQSSRVILEERACQKNQVKKLLINFIL